MKNVLLAGVLFTVGGFMLGYTVADQISIEKKMIEAGGQILSSDSVQKWLNPKGEEE